MHPKTRLSNTPAAPGVLLGICEWRVERNPAAVLGDAQTLAEHIRRKRVSLGMSQQGLAAELDVDPFTLSAWERGESKPRPWNRRRILDWLGFDPGSLDNRGTS
jgi:ribosome-binding protein aMBF1 (putative translation factor)